MWDVMFVMLFVLAIVLMLVSIENEGHGFWNLVSGFMSSIIFLILSLSQLEVEIPYTLYNSTSGAIETGTQTFTSTISPYLVYLFFGLFVVMQVYTWAKVFSEVEY